MELSYWDAKAALDWQIELGIDEAIGDETVDRYALEPARPAEAAPTAAPAAAPGEDQRPATPPLPVVEKVDAIALARQAAAGVADLGALARAMETFDHCQLKAGARSFVFCDGNPDARLMIVGEAPGRDEDRLGRPFVGRAGQLLDRMLAAIGMARDATDAERAVYITNVLPWRPPENRKPEKAEIGMFLPFLEAHIALARPELLILMGNTPCEALLGRAGITRLRGQWTEVLGVPALPMFHPAYLLRQPQAKREAWADLLDIQARLRGSH
ncbi:uracil-DNA glycosylase [Pelagovum pacificum]|uniref:Type-4 uracil-DNA glycosylase n=1 Tax=Pelagovum pacificum TaxID=2588711 RepID=A0A5C5GFW6_9RHOB|nr:uracil-DNA glycosylase [Pelagovum pacificum]QQA43228.1 uracil-DNA glycosylase [Pelagovum pacificum]TNY33632.1 uracil-DNA glycosylase [Pelagovum pacificum]